MKFKSDFKVNKEFMYVLVLVMLVVFGLLFLSHFDISVSSFTIKEKSNNKNSESDIGGVFEKLADKTSEMFKKGYSP